MLLASKMFHKLHRKKKKSPGTSTALKCLLQPQYRWRLPLLLMQQKVSHNLYSNKVSHHLFSKQKPFTNTMTSKSLQQSLQQQKVLPQPLQQNVSCNLYSNNKKFSCSFYNNNKESPVTFTATSLIQPLQHSPTSTAKKKSATSTAGKSLV